jgi:glutathione peroxidase
MKLGKWANWGARGRRAAGLVALCWLAAGATADEAGAKAAHCPAWLDQEMTLLRGDRSQNLCKAYGGKPVLIVNTASYCGFTPQFEGLEALYQRYREQGFEVAGFPSDDFMQEDDDAAKTAEVCYANYGVTFDMYSAISVRGGDAHPLFKGLAAEGDGPPRWNFYKYLVGADGKVIERFSSRVAPDDPRLVKAVEAALAQEKGGASE